MRLPFRDHHLIQFLENWQPSAVNPPPSHALDEELHAWHQAQAVAAATAPTSSAPLDRALYHYFRENSALGSKDREAISSDVYQLVRWSVTLDALLRRALHPDASHPDASHSDLSYLAKLPTRPKRSSFSWHQRLTALRRGDLEKRQELTGSLRVSMPSPLFELLCKSWGEEKALQLAEILQQQAPVFLRANALKTSRDELLSKLPESWQAQAAGQGCGIRICARPAVFQNPLFQEGHFEMQDEGSQQLAAQVHAQPGDWVLDYCAGSGGKTLAIAPALQGKGQLFLHDVRVKALMEARKRLKRAGIQNVQILPPDHPQLKKLKKHCQWVLVDAPCSGSGTLRRNPDMKVRIDSSFIQELISLQRRIFERALSFLAPGGTIVYATCSLLQPENEEQIAHFLSTYNLELVAPPLQLLPEVDGHDGFFAASMKRRPVA